MNKRLLGFAFRVLGPTTVLLLLSIAMAALKPLGDRPGGGWIP